MPPTSDMEGPLVADVEMEDDWDLWEILLSAGIDVQSSLCGDFLVIEEKCLLSCLDVTVNARRIF